MMNRALTLPMVPRWSAARLVEALLSCPLLALCPAMLIPVVLLLA